MKFNTEHDEWVADLVGDGFFEESSGDVAAPTGAFASVTFDTTGSDKAQAAASHYGTTFLILHQSNEGFVTILTFEDEESRDARYQELEQAFGLWSADLEPSAATGAIIGYRAIAAWVATTEEENPPAFTQEAQVSVRNDVIQYITENADDLKVYVEELDVTWNRVGHEFYLARNGHPAFSDHAAGPVVDALMESARAYGPQHAVLNVTGELEVQ